MAASALLAVAGVVLRPGAVAPAAGRATWRTTRLAMGVSDRMATDGILYDEWGKEGMRVLNHSTVLLQGGIEKGLSRYELVLTVAQRAKENAYMSTEEEEGYPGVADGMGPRLQPAKSEVVEAIEQLEKELLETGELPELADFDDEEPYGYRAEGGQQAAWANTELAAPIPQKVTTPRGAAAAPEEGALVGGDPPVVTDAVVPDDVLINDDTLVEEDFDDDDDDLEGLVGGEAEEALVGQVSELVGKALAEEPADGAAAADPAAEPAEELEDDLFAELFGGVAGAMGGADSIESGGMHPGDKG